MIDKEIAKKMIEISSAIQDIARIRHSDQSITESDYEDCIEGQLLKLIHVVTEKVKEKYGIEGDEI